MRGEAITFAPAATQGDHVPSDDAREIVRKTQAAARWSLLNNVVVRIGTLATGMLLARLLTPDDYGVYAVGLTVLTVFLSMNELGVTLALIRWDGDVRDFAPTVMTLAIGSSVLFYAVLYGTAPGLATLLNVPQAVGVLRLLSFAMVLDGVSTVPAGVLTREFAQGRRFIVDVGSVVVGSATTIALAAGGHGAISLAWGRIAGGLLAVTLVTTFCPLRVRPGWKPEQARALLRFGLPAAASSLLVLALLDVDYLIVGHSLGPRELGLYLLAFNMSGWPVSIFGEAARRVTFAGFSRLAGQEHEMSRAVASGIGVLVLVTAPVCALLVGYAKPLIGVLYGERWLPAVPALRILAVLGLVRVVYFLGYDSLMALGRSRVLIRLQLTWLALLVPTLFGAARLDGIRGVALGHVAVAALVILPLLLGRLSHHGLRVRHLLADVIPPLCGAAAICVTAVLVTARIDDRVAQLAVGGLAATLVYSPVLRWGRTLLPTAPDGAAAPKPVQGAPEEQSSQLGEDVSNGYDERRR